MLTLLVLKLEYFRITRSISWLLMPWLLSAHYQWKCIDMQTLLVLKLEYFGLMVNTMAADALVTQGARASATMALTMQDKRLLVLLENGWICFCNFSDFKNKNVQYCFLKIHLAEQGLMHQSSWKVKMLCWEEPASYAHDQYLNSLTPVTCSNFKHVISQHMYGWISWGLLVILLTGECYRTPLWWINIGSGNGLVPSGSKPLPVPILTKINATIWRH